MFINKVVCMQCHGKGYETVWKLCEQNTDGTGTAKAEEATCGQCGGTGFNKYPVFTTEEAIQIAKHFGFNIIEEA